jgi:hypothetical protein
MDASERFALRGWRASGKRAQGRFCGFEGLVLARSNFRYRSEQAHSRSMKVAIVNEGHHHDGTGAEQCVTI